MPRVAQPRAEEAQRLRDRIALGVLTATLPPELVDEAIEFAGRREQRYRLLPARLVVYYCLAMTLFREAGYEEVMRELTEGLAWMSGQLSGLELPSSVAISKARARLGPDPLAALFRAGCVPLATPATPGGFYRGLRLVGLDGSVLDTPDTAANATILGRPGTGRGESAFPQLRVVALAETGTHAMFAAAMGPCTTGEAPGQAARRLARPRHVGTRRPGLHRPSAVLGHGGHRCRAVLAVEVECDTAGDRSPW